MEAGQEDAVTATALGSRDNYAKSIVELLPAAPTHYCIRGITPFGSGFVTDGLCRVWGLLACRSGLES